MSSETTKFDPETPKAASSLDVILARHAAYNTEGEGVAEENIGGLTEQGIAQSQELGKLVFQKATEGGRPTDILFISSPTAYEDKTGRLYGKRAEQTAGVAMDVIMDLAHHLPASQVRLLAPIPVIKPEIPYHQRLTEPNIHYIPTADNPRAYFEKQVEKFGMRPDEADGSIGRKEGYARGDAEVDAVARQIGAETAQAVGNRAFDVVKDMKHLGDIHERHNPERSFLVVLVTHDDVMRSVAQNLMGVGEQAYGYFPQNTEMMPLHIEGNQVRLEFKSEVYNRDI